MLLAALRRIPQAHHLLALRGSWDGSTYYTYDHSGLELEDLPVGLVGYGAVGSRVARALCAFGAQVMVYDPYARGEIHGLRLASLDELLRRSRVVTLHARLTAETCGLIGARELAPRPAAGRGRAVRRPGGRTPLGGGPRHLRTGATAPALAAARPGRPCRADPSPGGRVAGGGGEGGGDRGGGGRALGARRAARACADLSAGKCEVVPRCVVVRLRLRGGWSRSSPRP